MAKIPADFWEQESHEKDHKDIKKSLEKVAKKPKEKSAAVKKRVVKKLKTVRYKSVPKKKTASKGKAKIEATMHEFKEGELKAGSKKGPKVTNKKQALAIALSSARKTGAKIPKKKK